MSILHSPDIFNTLGFPSPRISEAQAKKILALLICVGLLPAVIGCANANEGPNSAINNSNGRNQLCFVAGDQKEAEKFAENYPPFEKLLKKKKYLVKKDEESGYYCLNEYVSPTNVQTVARQATTPTRLGQSATSTEKTATPYTTAKPTVTNVPKTAVSTRTNTPTINNESPTEAPQISTPKDQKPPTNTQEVPPILGWGCLSIIGALGLFFASFRHLVYQRSQEAKDAYYEALLETSIKNHEKAEQISTSADAAINNARLSADILAKLVQNLEANLQGKTQYIQEIQELNEILSRSDLTDFQKIQIANDIFLRRQANLDAIQESLQGTSKELQKRLQNFGQ